MSQCSVVNLSVVGRHCTSLAVVLSVMHESLSGLMSCAETFFAVLPARLGHYLIIHSKTGVVLSANGNARFEQNFFGHN